jgi:hypothetical protein
MFVMFPDAQVKVSIGVYRINEFIIRVRTERDRDESAVGSLLL